MEAVSLEDQSAEIERELRLRRQVYPRWTSGPSPKLTKDNAARQVARLEAVHASLQELGRLRALAVAMGAAVSTSKDGRAFIVAFRSDDDCKVFGDAVAAVLCPVSFPGAPEWNGS